LRFLFIGRLLTDKGIREFAEAAARVRTRHPEVRFNVVGGLDSNPAAVSQAEVQHWVADNRLEWHGALPDVRGAIADNHVLILPSYREGTPRSVLEAMAMGRAVITTDAPGCRETIEAGRNGVLVPVRDVDALVLAVEALIANPGRVAIQGQAGRDLAVSKYDVHKVNAVMMAAMGL
jgi:glycosyltransferase involved in cell wall biosynthesis